MERVKSISSLIAPHFLPLLAVSAFSHRSSRAKQSRSTMPHYAPGSIWVKVLKVSGEGVKNFARNWLKVPPTVHPAKKISRRTENKNSGYGSFFWHQLGQTTQSNILSISWTLGIGSWDHGSRLCTFLLFFTNWNNPWSPITASSFCNRLN